VQVDFLQAKLSEEQAKRQRAEERARVLKNYSEKAKVNLQLRGVNAHSRTPYPVALSELWAASTGLLET
jgi:hypothetical protein